MGRRRRKIGLRAGCSVQFLHALCVTFECAVLFRTLKWAHLDSDIDFLPHRLANFAGAH